MWIGWSVCMCLGYFFFFSNQLASSFLPPLPPLSLFSLPLFLLFHISNEHYVCECDFCRTFRWDSTIDNVADDFFSLYIRFCLLILDVCWVTNGVAVFIICIHTHIDYGTTLGVIINCLFLVCQGISCRKCCCESVLISWEEVILSQTIQL